MGGVSSWLGWRFSLDTPQVSNDLPDSSSVIPAPCPVVPFGGHGCTRDALAGRPKQIGVETAVALLRPGKVGAAPAAPRTQPVTECTVDAELKFTGLRRLGIARERMLILAKKSRTRGQHQQQHNSPKASQIFGASKPVRPAAFSVSG
jgi:hypothetical protein